MPSNIKRDFIRLLMKIRKRKETNGPKQEFDRYRQVDANSIQRNKHTLN